VLWAGVAGAVAIVLALSWPALIGSIDARRWSAAAISLVALLLSGAYSVTAAAGLLRVDAPMLQRRRWPLRMRVQRRKAAYDAANAEFDALTATKPVTEIQTQIEAVRAELAKLPSTRRIAELETSGAPRLPDRPSSEWPGQNQLPPK
jgi:hypothetical protein